MMYDLIIRSRGSSPNVSSVHRGYSCGSCDVMAPTRPALRKHIADCHPALSGTETGETKRCPSTGCDFTTSSRCEMETHVAAHVAQGMTPTGKKRSLALQRVRYRYSNNILHIQLCIYPFWNFFFFFFLIRYIIYEIKIRDGINGTEERDAIFLPFFIVMHDVLHHLPFRDAFLRYEREEYRCSLCSYACTIEKAFQRHLRAHARGSAPETRVSCAVCGADRSSEVDLSRHMRRHRDDRYFCCDICIFRTVQLKKVRRTKR